MVQARLTSLALAAVLLVSCGDERDIKWSKIIVDGHITGVTAVEGVSPEAFLGTVADGVYTSPSGRTFADSSVAAVAGMLIGAQPRMAYLKEIIGWSPCYMPRSGDRRLGEWASSITGKAVENIFRTKVDLSVINSGGIRVDMPDGAVLMDDIVSMFPFKNNYALVRLKGSDLLPLLEYATTGDKFRMCGVAKDSLTGEITVGGKAVDANRTYRVASIDFLLDGGDGLFLGRNALEVKTSDVVIKMWIIDYVKSLYKQGLDIFGQPVGRTETK